MTTYILRRVIQVIPVLLTVSILVFLMLHFIPGDPAVIMAGIEASEDVINRIRVELGLDKPIPIQYLVFLEGIFKGDLGESIRTGSPVIEEIKNRFPYTFIIAFGATILASVLGIVSGTLAAVNRNKLLDSITMPLTLLAISTPSFWLGLMLMLFFSLYLGWLPSFGVGGARYFIMPIITLGTQSAGLIARMTRSAMLDVLSQDYIKTAKAKGLKQIKVINKHALKNALMPVVTMIGLRFGGLLAGTVLVESVFGIPGLGRMIVDSVAKRDYPMVQGSVLLIAFLFVFINLFVDIAYALIDPRIKFD